MVYDYSDVMRMIGRQKVFKALSHADGIKDILNAYELKYGHPIEIDPLINAFVLGYIQGKKEERTKRK